MVTVLDIDRRFESLPGFKYYDLQKPVHFDNEFEIILFDPPFFYITLEELNNGIEVISGKNASTMKLLMSFMIKDERRVLNAFKKNFNLERTKFDLEYATVEENRWDNYGLWANCDLPMIKRNRKKK